MPITVAQALNTLPDKRTAIALEAAFDRQFPSEIATSTRLLTADDNGSIIFLDAATEFVTTLPALMRGLRFTFIVKAAPVGTPYTIVTAGSANIIVGMQNSVAGDAGDTGTTDDTISFVAGSALAGDRVDVVCDGTNWFAYGTSKVAAGITFTTAT